MLEEMKLNYFEYTMASLAAISLKFLALPAWGRIVDRYGARPVYTLACGLIAVLPVPWLVVQGPAGAVLAQALSGFSWGAHEIGHFTLILETSPAQRRPQVFVALNLVCGTAQLLGTLVGAALMWRFSGSYLTVFAVSIAGRSLAAIIVPRLIPADATRPRITQQQVLLRVLGVRVSGGVEHRPMFLSGAETDEAKSASPQPAADPIASGSPGDNRRSSPCPAGQNQ